MRIIFLISLTLVHLLSVAAAQDRWTIENDGRLKWTIGPSLPHRDHIEMSGEKVSAILNYGVDQDKRFSSNRTIVFPMLRTIPNNTHASLIRQFNWNVTDLININKAKPKEQVTSVELDGFLRVRSDLNGDVSLTRSLFPSAISANYCEQYLLKNNSEKSVVIEIPALSETYTTNAPDGVDGAYAISLQFDRSGAFVLKPKESLQFGAYVNGRKQSESLPAIDLEAEKLERQNRISFWKSNLVLETPSAVLNTAFAFAKVRASESIFRTKGGLMHGPGGQAYYAAIWANDQAEYIGPFFPYLGYDRGNEASLNAYLHFARFMNKEYKRLPSSIIAEGLDIWDGAGDRGDAAMIAYGAARYALARGREDEAKKLWPLIEWCLEYCKRKLNSEGVVLSDSDELEGRFPAGEANLNTSSLYYDALNSAVMLGNDLNISKTQLDIYRDQARVLKQNIEKYFGSPVQGFNTYRYYKGNDTLRAWICTPLVMDIFDRKEETIKALFSPLLWTQDGLASVSGDKTFWDRATLYALRGVFAAGETEKALNFLNYYSNRRLLGEHVPYPVEAYPEGGQRHLSAESGLYCRVFTEGLFGIRPTGLKQFRLTPHLPKDWNKMALRKVNLCDTTFDIEISRENDHLLVKVKGGKRDQEFKVKEGESFNVAF